MYCLLMLRGTILEVLEADKTAASADCGFLLNISFCVEYGGEILFPKSVVFTNLPSPSKQLPQDTTNNKCESKAKV